MMINKQSKTMRAIKTATIAVLVSLASACAGIKQAEFVVPEFPEKRQWTLPNSDNAHQAIELQWWQGFGDAELDRLIDTAIRQNLDLKLATARLQELEAGHQKARGKRLPVMSLTLNDMHNGHISNGSSGFDAPDRLNAKLNWELDLWGKLKKGAQASEDELKASEANWRAIWLQLTGIVARHYFRIRRLDDQIGIRRTALENNAASLQLYQARMKAGFATQIEVDSQTAESNRLQREILELQRQRAQTENRIALLTGEAAGNLDIQPGGLVARITAPIVPSGLPSELLTRRPDIVASFYTLRQNHHLLDQAKLQRLPSFNLSGLANRKSAVLSNLLDNWTLGLASALHIPVFNPDIQSNIKIQQARKLAAEQQYKKTVLTAIEEVENALNELNNRKQQQALLNTQSDKLHTVTQQRRKQLSNGLISQLELFESERSLLSANENLADNHEAILSATVTLYQALGGGWAAQSLSDTAKKRQGVSSDES